MATSILTGRDCTLTIDGDTYTDQITSGSLALTPDRQEFDTWAADTAYKTFKTTGSLTLEMFQDWGAAGSLCEALFNATNDNPDVALAFSLVVNATTFTGFVYPTYPTSGGGAVDALSTSLTLTIQNGEVAIA